MIMLHHTVNHNKVSFFFRWPRNREHTTDSTVPDAHSEKRHIFSALSESWSMSRYVDWNTGLGASMFFILLPSIDVFRASSQHRCFSCSFSTSMFFVLILSTDVLRVPSQHRCFTCSFSASTFYMLLLSIDVLHAPSQHRRFTCSFPASTFYMLLLS